MESPTAQSDLTLGVTLTRQSPDYLDIAWERHLQVTHVPLVYYNDRLDVILGGGGFSTVPAVFLVGFTVGNIYDIVNCE